MKGKGRAGDPKGWFTPHVRNPEKYPDYRNDLIGGGGNTDICPGRQTPSRRYWLLKHRHVAMSEMLPCLVL